MASNIEQFLFEIKPQVLGWINQAIASASLNGITITLPPNIAYLDVEQTFTAKQQIAIGAATPTDRALILSGDFDANTQSQLVIWNLGSSANTGTGLLFAAKTPAIFIGGMRSNLIDATAGSEDAATQIRSMVNGTLTDIASFYGNGIKIGFSDGSAIPASALEIDASAGVGYITLNEISAPSAPASNKLSVYAIDGTSSITYLQTKDAGGNTNTLRPMAASGTGHAAGLTPDTPSGSGATKFLCEDATWSVPAGTSVNTWTLISESTASATATIQFTGLSSTYRYYVVIIRNLKPATDNVSLQMKVSTDNGSSYLAGTGYTYNVTNYIANSDTPSINRSQNDSKIVLCNAVGNAAAECVNAEIRLDNLPSAANEKGGNVSINWLDTASVHHGGTGYLGHSTTSAINAIQFLFSSGNISSGTIALYGVL